VNVKIVSVFTCWLRRNRMFGRVIRRGTMAWRKQVLLVVDEDREAHSWEGGLSTLQSESCAKSVALGTGVFVDRSRRTLHIDGHEQGLSAQKFDLLCYLIDHEGTAVRAIELVRCGILRPSQAQRFKGLIQELRARLGSYRDRLRAVPGYGYRLDLSDRGSD